MSVDWIVRKRWKQSMHVEVSTFHSAEFLSQYCRNHQSLHNAASQTIESVAGNNTPLFLGYRHRRLPFRSPTRIRYLSCQVHAQDVRNYFPPSADGRCRHLQDIDNTVFASCDLVGCGLYRCIAMW